MKYFEALGSRIELRWRQERFDDDALAEIAVAELERTPASEHVAPDDILDWCNQPGFLLPTQLDIDSKFGDPPITVFNRGRLLIDVYFWLNSTTVIHEHGFNGAFQVLSGSSMHTQYNFVEHARYNAHAYVGELSTHPSELLAVGATRGIESGPKFIHSLFHLEHPSTTVVVRSNSNRLVSIQRNFYRPGLALDGEPGNATMRRNEQVAELLVTTSNPRLDSWLERYFASAGPLEAFSMLTRVLTAAVNVPGVTHAQLESLLEPLLDQVEAVCWSGGVVVSAFREEWRRIPLTDARVTVKDADTRWFLALLLNGTKADVYKLVKDRFPADDPLAKVFGWVEALCGPTSPIGLGLNRSMLHIARRLAEGIPLEQIAEEVNATRKTPAPLGFYKEAETELRQSSLGVLF